MGVEGETGSSRGALAVMKHDLDGKLVALAQTHETRMRQCLDSNESYRAELQDLHEKILLGSQNTALLNQQAFDLSDSFREMSNHVDLEIGSAKKQHDAKFSEMRVELFQVVHDVECGLGDQVEDRVRVLFEKLAESRLARLTANLDALEGQVTGRQESLMSELDKVALDLEGKLDRRLGRVWKDMETLDVKHAWAKGELQSLVDHVNTIYSDLHDLQSAARQPLSGTP